MSDADLWDETLLCGCDPLVGCRCGKPTKTTPFPPPSELSLGCWKWPDGRLTPASETPPVRDTEPAPPPEPKRKEFRRG